MAGVPPPEAALAGLHGDHLEQLRRRLDDVGAHLDLPMVGGDEHRGRGMRTSRLADEAVGGAQLGVVKGPKPRLVGDLVDPP